MDMSFFKKIFSYWITNLFLRFIINQFNVFYKSLNKVQNGCFPMKLFITYGRTNDFFQPLPIIQALHIYLIPVYSTVYHSSCPWLKLWKFITQSVMTHYVTFSAMKHRALVTNWTKNKSKLYILATNIALHFYLIYILK